MKVAIFDPYLDTMSGGERYMLSIALCLQNDHQVSILWDKTPEDEIISLAKKRFSYDLSQCNFVPSFFSPQIGTFARYKKSKEFDLIIYLSDGSIPVVGCNLFIHFQSPMPWVKGRSLKNIIKLSRAKKIICNSQFTKKYIDELYGVRSIVLYPPVSIMENSEFKKENVVLNVGRFGVNHAGSSYKKQDIMAEVFKKMSDKNSIKQWKLVLVMSVHDQDMERVEEFKKKYAGLPIDFVINPDNDTLWEYYSRAKIYWHAAGFGEDIINHPDRAEHFGISTVEAMGAGVVPVVFEAGGQKEIVKNNENGILWKTNEELENATIQLMNDANLLSKLSKRAASDAKFFSIDTFCQNVQTVVQK
ncbi:MAG: glycosyltransferase family 4 protein [Candidatus Levybacteria bacterium]|nr:glycosyltransferase family 4 protein [Candidatus Levybacteria bacterium]